MQLHLPAEVAVGEGTVFHHHGWCVLVHESVEIGSDCNIYNQVVIGGGHDGPDGPPIRIIIEDNVNIGTGAKVLCKSGTLTIGRGSTIAANAVVLSGRTAQLPGCWHAGALEAEEGSDRSVT